ncbi:MAG TPA: uL4 family ribosomal protein, partial [Longimicrobiales bacterium]|nr:uL4 family ribosomal protein [Longimicrobiales bacterium]
KVKALARRSAFNARAEEDRVVLVDGLSFEAPKTRRVREFLKAIELDGRKVLLLTHGLKETVYLSARNLPDVEVRPFGEESPYDILWAEVVVIEREAMDALASEVTAEEEGEAEPAAAVATEEPEAAEAEEEPEAAAEEAVDEAEASGTEAEEEKPDA